jgi:hypothetical protein
LSIRPNDRSTQLAVETLPGTTCDRSVKLPSGAISEAGGLGPATADATGGATWNWKVGARTRPVAFLSRFTAAARRARTPLRLSEGELIAGGRDHLLGKASVKHC